MGDLTKQHELLIAGGGVAGMEIASTLARQHSADKLKITLIDRESAHVWKPMLHTIAAGTRDISQQQTVYLAQAHRCGFSYQPGELEGVDVASKEVVLAPVVADDGRLLVPSRRLSYDSLIIAVGSGANDFGTTGANEHCYRIDSRTQANYFNQEVRLRLLKCLAQDEQLTISIVGGGATGVELAAELMRLVEFAESYGALGLADRIRVTLVESGPRLLAAFPEDISEATRLRLESIGVRVILGSRVDEVESEALILDDGRRIASTLKVWAAGVKAPDFLSHIDGLETNQGGQLLIKASLQTTLDESIYAVGDCASLTLSGESRPLAPTAQVAHQQAAHLIRYLPKKIVEGAAIPDFTYRDFGSLVSLGDYDAFGSLGQFGLLKGATIRGRLAQLSHAMLYRTHQVRLHGFWRGCLLWLVDRLNRRTGSSIRVD